MGFKSLFGLRNGRSAVVRLMRTPVRIFRADPMRYTIFEAPRPPRLGVRIDYVDNPDAADLILASRSDSLARYGRLNRRFMIWTAEPRFSLEQHRRSAVAAVDSMVGVMNVYSGLIYQDNYNDLYAHRSPVDFDERMRAFLSKPNRIAVICTCRLIATDVDGVRVGGELIVDGRDVDLTYCRDTLAMRLYELGECDVYGNGWPEHVKVSGASRDGKWWIAKRKLLAGYAFSLAYENTYAAGYVTEKIWDAVAAASLPVYYDASNGVRRDFPDASFIEGKGKTADSLRREMLQMSRQERADRYEACLRAYIPVVREDRFRASRRSLLRRTGDFIEELMSSPPIAATSEPAPLRADRHGARPAP